MNLTSIISYIQNKLKEDPRLHSVILEDVYSAWNHTNSSQQYPSAVVDFMNNNHQADYVDYVFIVYVGSVIAENQKNIYPVISVADSVIQQMLHKIDVEDNELVLVIPNTITPFTQKFEDVTCGCYCQFTIRVSVDIIC